MKKKDAQQSDSIILNNILESIIISDLKGIVTYWNKGAERLFGYSAREMLGKPLSILYQKHTQQLSHDLKVIRNGKDYDGEWLGRRKDGSEVWVHVHTSVLKNEQRKMSGFIGVARDITQYKNEEDELTYYRTLVQNFSDAVISTDPNFIIRSWNKGAEKLYGWKEKEVMGKPARNYLPTQFSDPHEKQKWLKRYKRGSWSGEVVQKNKKGDVLYVIASISLIKDSKGTVIGEVAVNKDITDRKLNEQAKSQLAAIVESSEDAIIGKDLNAIVTNWNHGAEKMYGYTASEIIGKPITVIIPPQRINELTQIMQRIKKGKAVGRHDTQRLRKDKTIISVSVTISPIKDSSGTIIGASSIARDITNQLNVEKNIQYLSDASKVFSSSLDFQTTLRKVAFLAVPHMADWCTVDIVDREGFPQLLAVAHKDPQKVRWARQLRKLDPPDMNSESGIPRVLKTGESILIPLVTEEMIQASARDEEHLKLVRSLHLTSVMIVPILSGKKMMGAISFISSESRRKYTKADLAIAEELAKRAALAIENAHLYQESQKAVKLRDEFISVASHELKTPVTSLKVFTQVLHHQAQQKGEDAAVKYLRKMDLQVDKLTKLIKDLLDISRMQVEKLEFKKEKFDIVELAKEINENIQSTTQDHSIELSAKKVPEIIGDKDRIGQIMINLLTNAIKYSPHADKVLTQVYQENNHVTFSVKDFGIGISKEHQKKIFERFYQVNTPTEKTYPGLGIGLYISYEIAKRHGGYLEVESEKGKGSTFFLHLPLDS